MVTNPPSYIFNLSEWKKVSMISISWFIVMPACGMPQLAASPSTSSSVTYGFSLAVLRPQVHNYV